MVEPYERFAKYYDVIYHDLVDYAGDADYLEALFRKSFGRKPESVLDLGCGTGTHAIELARRGYDVAGVDVSRAQLQEARAKAREEGLSITFTQQDMRNIDLDRTFDAAISMFGGFGYLLTDHDVLSHFRHVRSHLNPDGLYAFEFWQESAVERDHRGWVHREKPFRLIRLDRNHHDVKRHRLTFDFTFFVFDGDRLEETFTETHTVRMYTIAEMRRLLTKAGFRLSAAYGATREKKGFTPALRNSFRVMAVAQPSRRRSARRAIRRSRRKDAR